MKGEAVVGAIVENAKFKLVYRVMDPDTADWVARMSGTILVDDEVRKAKTDAVLTESIDSERTIRQAERFFIDSNMILNLPDFVSFIFTTKTLPTASLIFPIKVNKRELQIHSVYPEIATSVTTVKSALDFSDEDNSPISSLIPNTPAHLPELFFTQETEHISPIDFQED